MQQTLLCRINHECFPTPAEKPCCPTAVLQASVLFLFFCKKGTDSKQRKTRLYSFHLWMVVLETLKIYYLPHFNPLNPKAFGEIERTAWLFLFFLLVCAERRQEVSQPHQQESWSHMFCKGRTQIFCMCKCSEICRTYLNTLWGNLSKHMSQWDHCEMCRL